MVTGTGGPPSLYRSVQSDPGVDFSLTEAERDLVSLCRDFAQKEIATRPPQAWDDARCPTDLLREMGGLGLLGPLIPEEWGGIGVAGARDDRLAPLAALRQRHAARALVAYARRRACADSADDEGALRRIDVGGVGTRSRHSPLVLALVDCGCFLVGAYAFGGELLGELIAFPRRGRGAAEHVSATARPAGAECDKARTDHEGRERDDAGDDDPAGSDGEGVAQHIHVDVVSVFQEDVDGEARGDADEQ